MIYAYFVFGIVYKIPYVKNLVPSPWYCYEAVEALRS